MKNIILICGVFFVSSVALLRAGSVIVFGEDAATEGKLTLNSSAIHVEGPSPSDVNLPDVLEADFADAPFQLTFFSSNGTSQLPADWKAQDIGKSPFPGSLAYAAGTFTLTSGGSAVDRKENDDLYFFAGRQWTGDDGQWTVRVQAMDPPNQSAEAGLMLRDSMNPGSVMFGLGAFGAVQFKGLFHYRNTAGERSGWGGDFPLDLPAWLRLTRNGSGIDGFYSVDGKQWQNIRHYDTKVSDHPWVGIFANSRDDKVPAKITLDQLTFTPPPCTAQILPAGVWLKSGSFLAGHFNQLDFDPAHPDAAGSFNRSGKEVSILPSLIAAVLMQPMHRSQVAAGSSQVGLLMKNGDYMAGDFQAINDSGARISSVTLGIINYDPTQVGACILHSPEPQPADYEIRLQDGSVIRASSFGVNNGQLVIGEISGVAVPVDPGEVAQFRAGTSRVQNLLELPWKATSLAPPAPVAPAVAPAATNAAAKAAPPAPAVKAAPVASAQCWEGPSQEQVLAVPAETMVDFPLKDKFNALVMKIALSSDTPANVQAGARIFADGREVARMPPLKSGDQPRFVKVTLQDPKTVTLVADSPFAGAKVLFIDPVVIRETQP